MKTSIHPAGRACSLGRLHDAQNDSSEQKRTEAVSSDNRSDGLRVSPDPIRLKPPPRSFSRGARRPLGPRTSCHFLGSSTHISSTLSKNPSSPELNRRRLRRNYGPNFGTLLTTTDTPSTRQRRHVCVVESPSAPPRTHYRPTSATTSVLSLEID